MRTKQSLDALATMIVKQNYIHAHIVRALVEVVKLIPADQKRNEALDTIQTLIDATTEEADIMKVLLNSMSEERESAE